MRAVPGVPCDRPQSRPSSPHAVSRPGATARPSGAFRPAMPVLQRRLMQNQGFPSRPQAVPGGMKRRIDQVSGPLPTGPRPKALTVRPASHLARPQTPTRPVMGSMQRQGFAANMQRSRFQSSLGQAIAAQRSQMPSQPTSSRQGSAGAMAIVSFDFHKTLTDGHNNVLPCAVQAVELISQEVGPENVRLLSYSGRATEEKTRQAIACSAVQHILTEDRLLFTREKTGSRGKAKLAQCLAGRKAWIHFDDKHCVVKDFNEHGMKAVMVSKKHNILDA